MTSQVRTREIPREGIVTLGTSTRLTVSLRGVGIAVALFVIASSCVRPPTPVITPPPLELDPGCVPISFEHGGIRAREPDIEGLRDSAGVFFGIVVDNGSGFALPGASVSVHGVVERRARSTTTGGFVLTGLPPGRYEVWVRSIGYHPTRDSILVARVASVSKFFRLQAVSCH